MKTNLMRPVRHLALCAGFAAVLGLGLALSQSRPRAMQHVSPPQLRLVDGVETHGDKQPPPKRA